MSREIVACTASRPLARSASASSSCVDRLLLLHEPQDRALAVELAHASTSSRTASPCASSSSVIVSGGLRRRTRSPAEPTRTPLLEARGDHVARDAVDLEAEQQAGAADLDGAGEPLERARERVTLAHDVRQQRLVHGLDDRARRGARDGVAAERARVVARLERDRQLVRDEQRADRQAVGETLRERDGVRLRAEPLPREEASGPPHAGLHLVEHEQRAVLVGDVARAGEELRPRRMDAALALNRLDQDARGLVVDRRRERRRSR